MAENPPTEDKPTERKPTNPDKENQYTGSRFIDMPMRKAHAYVLLATGHTKAEVERATGISQGTIRRIESGESWVDPRDIERARAAAVAKTEAVMTPLLNYIFSEKGIEELEAMPMKDKLNALIKVSKVRSEINLMDTEAEALKDMSRDEIEKELARSIDALVNEVKRDEGLAEKVLGAEEAEIEDEEEYEEEEEWEEPESRSVREWAEAQENE